ncbi:hypothetical protein LINGRAHAP2_LOCUS27588 [Linum grandiflorum]
MAPRKRNQESDLPQPFVEEEQVAAGDAGVGSSNNLVREEVPPQSAPTADVGGAVASLLQMMEGRLDGLGQNHQQVTLQLRSLDERYESYNSRVDRLAQTRNRSLDDVNPITHNFNANMSIPSAVGHSSQPRQENFSSPVNNQPSPHRTNRGDIPATTHVEGLNDVAWENYHHVVEIPAPRSTFQLTNLLCTELVNLHTHQWQGHMWHLPTWEGESV